MRELLAEPLSNPGQSLGMPNLLTCVQNLSFLHLLQERNVKRGIIAWNEKLWMEGLSGKG
jgi:hypothetical protein